MMTLVRPGLYRHQKGGLYVVVGAVTNATNISEDVTMVQYWSLKLGPQKMFVRELGEFFEPVRWLDGKFRARFILEELGQ